MRALHREDEGRCTVCIEYCECDDLDECSHANVPWPCRTSALLPPATQPTGEQIAQAELDRGEGVEFDNVEDAIAWLEAPDEPTQEGEPQ